MRIHTEFEHHKAGVARVNNATTVAAIVLQHATWSFAERRSAFLETAQIHAEFEHHEAGVACVNNATTVAAIVL
ncbi:hypothetical protein E2562_015279 [Oryza meyeriana var. granulata]|uniref:Uncharacterized protein n=1 Tax=Oryza meyeriana var. granulata TaxID=110450 RepID=A0A6G1DJF9_9ORYZ|nr:hypothetical protein E2562_015279 [Oryza meyeriana var. granulata]